MNADQGSSAQLTSLQLEQRMRRFLQTPAGQTFLIMALGAVCYVISFDSKICDNGDNIHYYLLGRNLVRGHGYTEMWGPQDRPATHFPPGYPMLMAIQIFLFGENSFVMFKVCNGVLLLLSFGILYRLLLRWSRLPFLAFITCAVVATNPHLHHFATLMMSEIPFIFFSLLTLYLATTLDKNQKPFLNPRFWVMLACLGMSYYIRTFGLALAFGIVAGFALRRQWAYCLATLGGCVLLALPWHVRTSSIEDSYVSEVLYKNPYLPEMGMADTGFMLKRFWKNLSWYMVNGFPFGVFAFLEDPQSVALGWGLGLIIVTISLVGLIRLREHAFFLCAYVLSGLSILFIWTHSGIRFLLPLVPLITFLFFYGLHEILQFSTKEHAALFIKIAGVFAVIISFAFAHKCASEWRTRYTPGWQRYFEMAAWVKKNLPPDAIICCRKPGFFHFYSDRRATSYINTSNEQALLQDLREKKVTHAVLAWLKFGSTARFLAPAIKNNRNLFHIVHIIPDPETILLRFEGPKANKIIPH